MSYLIFSTRRGALVAWLLPLILGGVLFVSIGWVKAGYRQNNIGKPATVSADRDGRVESVLVKPGDRIRPGQELVAYTILDAVDSGEIREQTAEVLDVTIHLLEGTTFVDLLELPGLTRADVELDVAVRVAGNILSMDVNEGSPVKAGDLLCRIDPRDYLIARDQAEAGFKLAELQFNRLKDLVRARAANQADLDAAVAGLADARARLDAARLALERCELKAPVDGVIDRRLVDVGEFIDKGRIAFRIVDTSTMRVEIGIPEQDISHVRSLQEMEFSVPALGEKLFTGKVVHISLSGSDVAKVYPIRLEVDNADGRIMPNMFVRGRVVREVFENAILLPLFSVIPSDVVYYTFVEQNGRAVRRDLKLGTFQTRSVHVLEGLVPGERVIAKGLRLVGPDAPVRVVE